MLLRHAWDKVEFSIPRALVCSYDMPGIKWSFLSGIQGFLSRLLRHAWDTVEFSIWDKGFSIPRALVGSYDMPGIKWSFLSRGP